MRRLLFGVLALLAGAAVSGPGAAQELPRRPFLGIAMESGEADGPQGSAVRVERVIEGSSAAAADIRPGDIIVSVDGRVVAEPADVVAAVKPRRAQDRLSIVVSRAGTLLDKDVPLIGLPLETAEGFDTLYEAVVADGDLRRTILTRPFNGDRMPAVLFVGGIGCYSMESPFDEDEVYRQLLSSITRLGFVTMRVEKSGMGDSRGATCSSVDLANELGGYMAGLQALRSKSYVDADRIFIVGHSIGGIVGPLLASKMPVRGIVAMETVGTTWFEYELINRRRQLKLAGTAPAALGRAMQLKQWCMHRLLIERQPRQEILASRPECAGEIDLPASDAYLQQIAELDLPALWAGLKLDTLLVYGSADYLTSAEEHLAILETIEAARPGAASFVEIADLDHYMTRAADQRESFDRKRMDETGDFHQGLAQTMGDWLLKHAG